MKFEKYCRKDIPPRETVDTIKDILNHLGINAFIKDEFTIKGICYSVRLEFKSIEGSLKVTGIFRMSGLIGKDKLEKEREEFEKKLNDDKNGFVILDQGTDYTPIPFYGRSVNKDLLKFFDDKIRRHFSIRACNLRRTMLPIPGDLL